MIHSPAHDHSHYQFTPRDLTRWVVGLLRYPLATGDDTPLNLLHIWVYEANRLFRDRLVGGCVSLYVCLCKLTTTLILGSKAKSDFDAIVKQVLRSDWSVDPPPPDVHYVMWGRPQVGGGDSDGCRPLGRLSSTDLAELVERTVVTYGECQ